MRSKGDFEKRGGKDERRDREIHLLMEKKVDWSKRGSWYQFYNSFEDDINGNDGSR